MSVSRPDPPGATRLVAARVREMAGLGNPADAREHATPLAAALGGWRGMFDSGFPALVFVSANAIDGLRTGVIAALGAGLLILLLRLARRQPVSQAVYGFVAVAVCAFVAARLGKAEGYFLPGILINACYAGVGFLSVLVKRPLAGYALAALDRRFEKWRVSPALRRCSGEITLIWSGVFLLRFAVQTMLYASERVGWLAVTKIVLGWPVTATAILVTLALIRRSHQEHGAAGSPATVPAGATPGGATPGGATPGGATLAGATPAGAVPAGATPAGAVPAGATPAVATDADGRVRPGGAGAVASAPSALEPEVP